MSYLGFYLVLMKHAVLLEQEVTFKVDYNVPSINRDFGTVFVGDKNVAVLVVSQGWAKVKHCLLSCRCVCNVLIFFTCC